MEPSCGHMKTSKSVSNIQLVLQILLIRLWDFTLKLFSLSLSHSKLLLNSTDDYQIIQMCLISKMHYSDFVSMI